MRKPLSLRNKILIGFLVVLAFSILLLIISLYRITSLGRASDAILKNNYHSILASHRMSEALNEQDRILFQTLYDSNQSLNKYLHYQREFELWLVRAKDNITEKGENEILQSIDRSYMTFLIDVERIKQHRFYNNQNIDQASLNSIDQQLKQIQKLCMQLKEINEKAMFEKSSHAQQIARNAITTLWLIGSLIILLGLFFGTLLANFIVKPIKRLLDATHEIANGHYDVHIETTSNDELGVLTTDFNQMASRLNDYNQLILKANLSEKIKNQVIIESIGDGIIVVDMDYRIMNLNRNAALLFQIRKEDALSRHFLETINNEQLFAYLKECVEQGIPLDSSAHENLLQLEWDQQTSYYQYEASLLLDDSKKIFGVVLLLRNITKLKELDRLKSEFVMIASHELKTPLTGISMSVDLLKESAESKLSDYENELLTIANEDISRLKALVSDLLDLSKIEAGKLDLQMERVSAEDVLQNVTRMFKTQTEELGIELSYTVGKTLSPIRVDNSKLHWVFTNLVGNAMRYVKKGGFIRMHAENLGKYVAFSVKDNGIGIPVEYQSKIFDKFVQVKDRQESKGTGLGLSICREIVRAHGGTIWLESEQGKGSDFIFTIPLYEEKGGLNE